MKKIMISQPMNGFTYEQIVETRNRFLEYAKKENLEVVNTYFTDEVLNHFYNMLGAADAITYSN